MKPTAEHAPVRTRSSVRTRIGILVAGVVALVVGIFALAAYHEVRQSALELAEDRMFGAADRFAASLSSTAGQFLEDVRAGADEPAVARRPPHRERSPSGAGSIPPPRPGSCWKSSSTLRLGSS